MVLFGILVAALLPAVTLAANNWTQPCHTGECEWDLPAEQGSGTMRLSGSNSSISDLTPAGGWTIVDCNSTSADQDIRIVCDDPSKCDHLFRNGAENTLVRLPEDCSSEPFAIVTRVWNHTDQSVPASRRSVWKRRGDPQRLIQGISLSTDFAGMNSSQHGNITVLIVGTSVPGIDNIIETVPDCSATDIVSSAHGCSASSVALKVSNPLSKRSDIESGNFTLPDLTFHTNLFNFSFSCPQSGSAPAFNGNVSADLTSTVGGSISYAITFSGILSALDSSALSLVVGFDASLDGTLSLDADLVGTFSTGDIPLYSVGLPGLDFGSVLKIGPSFNIYAEADASIGANLEMDVDLVYTISGGQLVYPPSNDSSSGGSFSPGTSNVKLSASPNVTATAQLAAHLKPTFEFGISLLDQTADIYLDLDTYAELDLSLTGAASGSVSSDGSESTSTGVGGCVDILVGLSVDVGAEADLFGIFTVNEKLSLYNQSFDLYKTCFGNGYERRRDAYLSPFEGSLDRRDYRAADGRRVVPRGTDGFSCPSLLMGDLVTIVEAIVDAASL